MKEEYREAFAEIDKIFDLMPSGLLNKIPNRFKELVKENKSKSYEPNIQEPFEDCVLKDETHIILSLIYRDFLCDEQEKQELLLRDSQKLQEIEEELRQKYDTEEIFKKRKSELNQFNNTEIETMELVEVKEKNFLQKIFQKIKNFFTRKNS